YGFVIVPNFGNITKNRVMGRNTSISLGNYFEDFVRSQTTTGRYKNASEVIRAGLRLLEERENKVKALRREIQKDLDSGIAEEFDHDEFLKKLKAEKHRNG